MNDNRRKPRRWQGQPMRRGLPESLMRGSHAIAEARRRLQATLRLVPSAASISTDERELQLAWARAQLHARREREGIFGEGLFFEPAWDMLLELFVAHLEGRKITVKNACVASAVPQTTALRYIAHLVERGLIVRQRHPADSRSSHLVLTDEGCAKMIDYVSRASALPTEPEE